MDEDSDYNMGEDYTLGQLLNHQTRHLNSLINNIGKEVEDPDFFRYDSSSAQPGDDQVDGHQEVNMALQIDTKLL